MGEVWVFSAQDLIPNELYVRIWHLKNFFWIRSCLDILYVFWRPQMCTRLYILDETFVPCFSLSQLGESAKDGKTWHGPMTDLNNGSHDDQPWYFRLTAPVTQTCMTNQDKQKSGSYIWSPLQTQIGLRPRNLRYTNDSRPIWRQFSAMLQTLIKNYFSKCTFSNVGLFGDKFNFPSFEHYFSTALRNCATKISFQPLPGTASCPSNRSVVPLREAPKEVSKRFQPAK